MKINITKKEYQLLLDMLYLSDWMMHSYETNCKDNEYKKLRKKFLSFYKEMGADNKIEYSSEHDDYYEREPYDSTIHEKFIETYENNFFWDELIDRLGRRDVVNQMGIDTFQSLDNMERITKVETEKEKYANEFEHHGLDNLKVIYEESIVN